MSRNMHIKSGYPVSAFFIAYLEETIEVALRQSAELDAERQTWFQAQRIFKSHDLDVNAENRSAGGSLEPYYANGAAISLLATLANLERFAFKVRLLSEKAFEVNSGVFLLDTFFFDYQAEDRNLILQARAHQLEQSLSKLENSELLTGTTVRLAHLVNEFEGQKRHDLAQKAIKFLRLTIERALFYGGLEDEMPASPKALTLLANRQFRVSTPSSDLFCKFTGDSALFLALLAGVEVLSKNAAFDSSGTINGRILFVKSCLDILERQTKHQVILSHGQANFNEQFRTFRAEVDCAAARVEKRKALQNAQLEEFHDFIAYCRQHMPTPEILREAVLWVQRWVGLHPDDYEYSHGYFNEKLRIRSEGNSD